MNRIFVGWNSGAYVTSLGPHFQADLNDPIAGHGRPDTVELRAEPAAVQWVGEIPPHGFGIIVPEAIARLAKPGSWDRLRGDVDVLVRGTVATTRGPFICLEADPGIESGWNVEVL